MITIRNRTITKIITSSIMGHSGGGMFPLTLWPAFKTLLDFIKRSGTVNLTKSSTYLEHRGNFRPRLPWTWRYIQKLGSDGLLNAYGLTNAGLGVNAPAIARAMENGYRVIPSFYPQFAKGQDLAIGETDRAVDLYRSYLKENFWALELNFSCPNSREKINANIQDALACVSAIKFHHPTVCLIAKISLLHPHSFASQLVETGIEIIHAVNTVPYGLVFDGQISPLARVGGGGVSGGPAFKLALAYNRVLRHHLPKTPIIMGCGAVSLDNVRQYLDIGADAVSICTVCRRDPGEAAKIINRFYP